jgi:outer membrane receptor protein involved in Fe transport
VRPPYAPVRIALLIALAVSAPSLPAQDEELEQITVTGSRIARPDYSSASPIVSVTQELFERTGSSTVETAINTLPQFVPGYTSTSNNPGNGGQANVQLRGLGSTSTLVLIDGKRLIPANGTGVADLNIIPGSLIESVEIITGGASAVYGSDAVAGVVNFRLKNEFDGVEFDAQWGQTDRDDGADWGGGVTAGLEFADGRGSVVGYVGYAEREAILAAERDFSRYALFYLGPDAGGIGPNAAFVPFGSSAIEEGRVGLQASEDVFNALFASYGFPAGSVPFQTNFGFNTDGTVFSGGDGSPGSVTNFRGERDPIGFNDSFYNYNFAPANHLQLPLERVAVFARAGFEFGESAELYAQGLFADYAVDTQLAPAATFEGMLIPPTNPFIPADLKTLLDSRANPAADVRMIKRLSELGPRVSSFEYEVYQATLGLRGDVFTDWSYDAYLQIGANDQTETQSGNALLSKIEELTRAPDGGVSICGGFDPFGLDSISAECAAYIAFGGTNRAAVDQTIAEASLTGPLLSLPAGELRAAFGVFYKKDEYRYDGDAIAAVFLPDGRADVQGFNASDDIEGDDDNADLYVEASIPLLADLPGARMLEFVVGYRHSEYASAGGADAYKAELIYQPIEPVRLRGSFQHAVRAPSVYELYLPQLPFTFGGFFIERFDPCEAGSAQRSGPDAAQVEALCLAQGVPAALLADFELPDNDARGFIGGNPDLDPEEADTLTLGVVFTSPFQSPWLDRLQVSLDWYRIEIEDAIVTVFFDEFIDRCFDRTHNPSFEPANRWCGMFSRNPADGDIVDAFEILRNSEGFETAGVDLQLDWRIDLGPGELGLNWLVSYLDSFEQLEAPGIPPRDLAGTAGRSESFIGRSLPEWKWSFGVSYAWQALTLDARWRYIDGMQDADRTLDPVFRIPHYDYIDVGASYDFSYSLLDGLRLRVGIENATDEDPPIFPSYAQSNTDPSQYDVLGRRYYLSLNYRF